VMHFNRPQVAGLHTTEDVVTSRER
jgi:hypothetical protein